MVRFDNCSKFHNQPSWRDLYDQLMTHDNLDLKVNKMFMWALKNYEESGDNLGLDLLTILD